MKVLLLEDNPSMQRATTSMLRRVCGRDVEVCVVDTCADAIAALQFTAFDFVVSDYEVLDGTADTLLSWVRAARPDLLPRLVLFTGTYGLEHLHNIIIDKGSPDTFITRMRFFVAGLRP